MSEEEAARLKARMIANALPLQDSGSEDVPCPLALAVWSSGKAS